MNTTDTVLLIIVTALLSIFIIMCIAVVAGILKLLTVVKRVVEKAETVAESVESAAEILRDTQGRLALFKLVRNIIKVVQRSRK
jgi:hypothetical protein